ncbi:mediator complex subunit MED14-domain-containing protein [Cladochytrium replicatum]|nr:mediator complex subunit MED14-domain-containing protein [Cladochytrium replicatum]
MMISTPHEQLPDVFVNTVPLAHVFERVIQKVYTDLLNLSEVLPNIQDHERKKQLLRFALSSRQLIAKLLVVLRWAKQGKSVQTLQNIHAFIESQDAQIAQVADNLFKLHGELKGAREPTYDVLTAIDVLTTGKYQRLPSIIKKSIVPPAPLTQLEKDETLSRLEEVMSTRLLCDEILPAAFRRSLKIERGRVNFTAEDEFLVSLTLDGNNLSLPWKIVDMRILVKPGGDDSIPMALQAPQVQALGTYAQQKLQPRELEKEGGSMTKKRRKRWPLVDLYDYLHHFCQLYQLEILRAQAEHLSRTRWKDEIRVEYLTQDAVRPVLRVHYWTHQSSQRNPGATTEIGHILEISVVTSPRLASKPSTPLDRKAVGVVDPMVVRAYTLGQEESIGKGWRLAVRCLAVHNVVSAVPQLPQVKGPARKTEVELEDPRTGKPVDITCPPSNIDLERLLLRAAEVQAYVVMHRLREILLGTTHESATTTTRQPARHPSLPSSARHTPAPFLPPSVSSPFLNRKRRRLDSQILDAEIVRSRRGTSIASELESVAGSVVRARARKRTSSFRDEDLVLVGGGRVESGEVCSLLVRLRVGRRRKVLRVTVDTRTGKVVVVQADGAGAETVETGRVEEELVSLRKVERSINAGLENVLDAVMDLRFASMIQDVRVVGNCLGFRAVSSLPLKPEELSKIASPLPSYIVFLRFTQSGEDHYLAIAAIDDDEVAFASEDPQTAKQQQLKQVQRAPKSTDNEAYYKVWLVSTRLSDQPNLYVIDQVTPISHSAIESGTVGRAVVLVREDERARKRGRCRRCTIGAALGIGKGGTARRRCTHGHDTPAEDNEATNDSVDTSALKWSNLDVEVLSKIEDIARAKVAFTKISRNLKRCGLQYEYVMKGMPAPVHPSRLIVPECDVTGLDSACSIAPTEFSLDSSSARWRRSTTAFVDDEVAVVNASEEKVPSGMQCPFGSFYLYLRKEKHLVSVDTMNPMMEDGDAELTAAHVRSLAMRTSVLSGSEGGSWETKLCLIGKVRLRMEILPGNLTSEIVKAGMERVKPPSRSGSWHFGYDEKGKVVSFIFGGVDDEDCRKLVAEWRCIYMVEHLAGQLGSGELMTGIDSVEYDLLTLTIHYSKLQTLRIHWEESSVGRSGEHDGRYVVAISALQKEEDSVEPLGVFIEELLNDCRSIRNVMEILQRTSGLMASLGRIEKSINTSCTPWPQQQPSAEFQVLVDAASLSGRSAPVHRIASVIPRSCTHFRLQLRSPDADANESPTGSLRYALDVTMLPGGALSVFDAAYSSFCANTLGMYPNTLLAGYVNIQYDSGIIPIPFFASDEGRAGSSKGGIDLHVLGQIEKILRRDEKMKGTLEGAQRYFLPFPHGAIFHASMLEELLEIVENHLVLLSTVSWLEAFLASVRGKALNIKMKRLELSFTTADSFGVQLLPVATREWKFELKPPSTSNSSMSEIDSARLASYLEVKSRSVSSGTNMRSVLQAIASIFLLPEALLRVLGQIAKLETDPPQQNRVEWCIVSPAEAFNYLPAPGQAAFTVDFDLGRISMLLKFSKRDGSESAIVPLRYNYKTGVFGIWRSNRSLGSSGGGALYNDWTAEHERTDFLAQVIGNNMNSADAAASNAKILEKVLCKASLSQGDVGDRHPLYLIVRYCETQQIAALQNLV